MRKTKFYSKDGKRYDGAEMILLAEVENNFDVAQCIWVKDIDRF